ncbi:RDD family protein [Mycolicibacterium conceptionense]|uniref:RDD family protein n=1 Tax=Mycolicibacterium conceptionense TaxID=451644 RepID=UPI0009D68486|nr:RDD family protein [Mycolicibacterium conceptionense]
MTFQPPPGPGYIAGPNSPAMNPYPSPYPPVGQGSPYGPGPTAYPAPGPSPYPAPGPSTQWNYGLPAPNPHAYTPWLTRVLASVIDQIPMFVIFLVGYGVIAGITIAATSGSSSGDEPSGGAVAAIVLAFLVLMAVTFAFPVWNFGYRQGKTGQSIGKQVMKFKVISEKTGQPIGFGLSLLRQIVHIVDGFFYIGYLMPLWDGKRQTIADKIMTTVCVPPPPPTPAPPAYPGYPGPQGGLNPYPGPPR